MVAKRVQVLSGHLAEKAQTNVEPALQMQRARARAALPRFDTTLMEKYIDDLADLKEEVYEVFRRRPDLLPPIIEDLTKGVRRVSAALHCLSLDIMSSTTRALQSRATVRLLSTLSLPLL